MFVKSCFSRHYYEPVALSGSLQLSPVPFFFSIFYLSLSCMLVCGGTSFCLRCLLMEPYMPRGKEKF